MSIGKLSETDYCFVVEALLDTGFLVWDGEMVDEVCTKVGR